MGYFLVACVMNGYEAFGLVSLLGLKCSVGMVEKREECWFAALPVQLSSKPKPLSYCCNSML
jgi:hypothetical protein